MNSPAKDGLSWSQKRFGGAVAVLFILQVGLILLFGDRSRSRPPLPSPAVRFRALGASVSEDQLLRQFFVGDPAVFPLPNLRGFSGRGWLDQSPLIYHTQVPLESAVLLDLDMAQFRTNLLAAPVSLSRFVSAMVSQFGTNFPGSPSAAEPILSGLGEQPAPREEPLPVFLSPQIAPTQSIFRLQGGLNDRLVGPLPALRTWPSENLLKSSIVQIAVSPLGEVVAARLDASCGLTEADADAVATARALRFRPSRSVGPQWAKVIFQWQTTPPPAANSAK
jgi:hypothetical protein